MNENSKRQKLKLLTLLNRLQYSLHQYVIQDLK